MQEARIRVKLLTGAGATDQKGLLLETPVKVTVTPQGQDLQAIYSPFLAGQLSKDQHSSD